MNSKEKFLRRFEEGYHICVGLDTDISKVPKYLLALENPILEFNKRIIDAFKKDTAAFKINFAFYEVHGHKGLETLKKTVELVPDNIPVIGDAKRGDIGNTAKMYAESLFDFYKFDAVTLHPYMGFDSVQPFLEYSDKISFILGLTSNQSSKDFEKLKISGNRFLFQEVIEKTNEWNVNENCGIVFGATNPKELKENMDRLRDLIVLLPGVGAQGGTLEEVTPVFKEVNHNNYLINISRSLIYADSSEKFAEVAYTKLLEYNDVVRII